MPLAGHAKVRKKSGQWYECKNAAERVAVLRDRRTPEVKNLIVNADDLGWTVGVNRGIVEAHRKGLVTSTSLLANGQAFAAAAEIRRSYPELGIGVHLNLSDGPPTAPTQEVNGLLGKSGGMED